jgi:hypothetical protein
VSQQGARTDRSVGIPLHHGGRFADARSRSKAFDELREAGRRRARKDRRRVTASDFAVGETLDVVFVHPNGQEIRGSAAVIDVQAIRLAGHRWSTRRGAVYVSWLSGDDALQGHVFALEWEPGYGSAWSGVVRWVPA